MARITGKVGVVLAAILVTAGLSLVWADVATPRPQWTKVRMEAETVNIVLGEKKVAVDATFNMYNEGPTGPVKVGYPLGVFETELHDFAATVDGQAVQNIRTEAGVPASEGPRMRRDDGKGETYRFEGPYKQWKVFDIDMQANAPRIIKVNYWVEPAPIKTAEKADLLHYVYTLRTGATWKGKIGRAVINVTLDGIAPSRLVRVVPVGAVASQDGKVLTWTYQNFKPADNIEVTFRPTETVRTASLSAAPPTR
jgi:hypothetical protein